MVVFWRGSRRDDAEKRAIRKRHPGQKWALCEIRWCVSDAFSIHYSARHTGIHPARTVSADNWRALPWSAVKFPKNKDLLLLEPSKSWPKYNHRFSATPRTC